MELSNLVRETAYIPLSSLPEDESSLVRLKNDLLKALGEVVRKLERQQLTETLEHDTNHKK